MQKILWSCLLFLAGSLAANAQLIRAMSGADITILPGTQFSVENLLLTPSSTFVISNNSISKTLIVTHVNSNPYIARVYTFNSNSNAFSGAIQIYYNDGPELNGIPENELTLNNHNGTNWTAYSPFSRDNTNNFVNSTGLSGIVLNEFTLASMLSPLPYNNLHFTAQSVRDNALLNWNLSLDNRITNFSVQHSLNGFDWKNIGTVTAQTNPQQKYSFEHREPGAGLHYYRIQLFLNDGRTEISEIKKLNFIKSGPTIEIIGNPVVNGRLSFKLSETSKVSFFTTGGVLLWNREFNAGRYQLDVQSYAPGPYFLQSNAVSYTVLIQ